MEVATKSKISFFLKENYMEPYRNNGINMPAQTASFPNTNISTAEGYFNVFVNSEQDPHKRDFRIGNACICLNEMEQAKFDAIMLGEMFKQNGYCGEK
jgi:hypothetical protein